MFDFDVELWQWIVSQVFGFFALALMFYSLQTKCKIRTLLATIGSNITFAIATALLTNWVLTGILLVAVFRDFAYIWLDKKGYPKAHPMSLIVLFTFISLTVLVVILTMGDWWYNWLILAGSIFIITGYWTRNIHLIRSSRITHAIIAIINHVVFSNLMGLLLDGASIISIIIFYIFWIDCKRRCKHCKKVKCLDACA